MAVRDIVEIAGDALPTRSKDIKRKGEESRFVRTAPGRYTIREFVTNGLIQMGDSGNTPQPIRMQYAASESTIPVLSQALSGERRGLMAAQSASSQSASSQSHESALQDDVNSL
jgi:hypothetical protein